MTGTILVVEDEPKMAEGLKKILQTEGFAVQIAGNGEHALRLVETHAPALVVLDVMLPGKGGFEVVREMRARDVRTPVLMLTAKSQEADKVLGLELGADDYLTKPFGVPELLARIRALLRRVREPVDRLRVASFGDLEIDFIQQSVRCRGHAATLSHHENGILRLLVAYKGEPVSRERILEEVWGPGSGSGTRVVDYHVTNLRKKVGPEKERILTVHGMGYKFVP